MTDSLMGAEMFSPRLLTPFSENSNSLASSGSGSNAAPDASASGDATARTLQAIQEVIGDDVRIVKDRPAPEKPSDSRLDKNGLYSMMKTMRQPFKEAVRSQTQGSLQGALLQTVQFSFQSAFAHLTRKSQTRGLNGLMESLQSRFNKLAALDPKQAERLRALLGALAILDPDQGDKILERIAGALEGLDAFYEMANPIPAPPAASQSESPATATPDSAPTNPESGSSISAQMIHFKFDMEISRTERVDSLITELNDQGITAKAVSTYSSQTIKISVEFTAVLVQQSDPLVLDLAGDGVDLSSAADGANFDITGNGGTNRTAFVRGDDAFLALDRNGNGRVDNGRELFGDQNGARNGFEELAKYDSDRNAVIDSRDGIYESLRLLHDKSGDGRVDFDEMSTLSEMGIESIHLRYQAGKDKGDGKGNRIAEISAFTRTDGGKGQIVDAWLGYY